MHYTVNTFSLIYYKNYRKSWNHKSHKRKLTQLCEGIVMLITFLSHKVAPISSIFPLPIGVSWLMRIKWFSNDQNRCDVSAGTYTPQSTASRAWTIEVDNESSNIKLFFKQKNSTLTAVCTSLWAISNTYFKSRQKRKHGTNPITTAITPMSPDNPHAICCFEQLRMHNSHQHKCQPSMGTWIMKASITSQWLQISERMLHFSIAFFCP